MIKIPRRDFFDKRLVNRAWEWLTLYGLRRDLQARTRKSESERGFFSSVNEQDFFLLSLSEKFSSDVWIIWNRLEWITNTLFVSDKWLTLAWVDWNCRTVIRRTKTVQWVEFAGLYIDGPTDRGGIYKTNQQLSNIKWWRCVLNIDITLQLQWLCYCLSHEAHRTQTVTGESPTQVTQ